MKKSLFILSLIACLLLSLTANGQGAQVKVYSPIPTATVSIAYNFFDGSGVKSMPMPVYFYIPTEYLPLCYDGVYNFTLPSNLLSMKIIVTLPAPYNLTQEKILTVPFRDPFVVTFDFCYLL